VCERRKAAPLENYSDMEKRGWLEGGLVPLFWRWPLCCFRPHLFRDVVVGPLDEACQQAAGSAGWLGRTVAFVHKDWAY
jgi:hypothetical protein